MSGFRLIAVVLLVSCGPSARPTANPGPLERNVKSGETVTFDGSESIGAIDSYSWDFGDATAVAVGRVVTHVYAKDGNFSATLTVRAGGFVHSASVVVNVGAGCNAVAGLAVSTTNPQPNQPVRLVSTGSRGCDGAALVTYFWEFGDGQSETGDATKSSTEHTWTAAGSYSIALTVTDAKGHGGRATRTLGIGVAAGKPTVQCPATLNAVIGRSVTMSATASDPGGMTISAYAWAFGDGTPNGSGASVQHVYGSGGTKLASVTATTSDARTSEPCAVTVNVAAPPDYSGPWVLNPASASLLGCSNFSLGFPVATVQVQHANLGLPDGGATLADGGTLTDGGTLLASPSGSGWPVGVSLSGAEDAPPAAPGTFRLRKVLPNETRGACGVVQREDSVEASFTSPTTVTGTWKIIFTATMCLGGGAGCVPATCNCVAQSAYTGVKQ